MDLLSQAGPAVWSTEWLRRHGVTILVIIVAAIIVSMIARLAVRRMQTRMQRAETGTQEIALARSATITHALTSAVRWVVWTIAVLLILGEFNINLAPLIAGAGWPGWPSGSARRAWSVTSSPGSSFCSRTSTGSPRPWT